MEYAVYPKTQTKKSRPEVRGLYPIISGQRLDGLIAHRQAKNRLQRKKLERTKRLRDEAALGRPFRKSPLLDFVDDWVHRPPSQEQMRQLKQLLLEEQKALAKLIALVDQHLE